VFLTKTFEQWEELLVGAGIPMGAINTVDKVVKHPQIVARRAMVDVDHPRAGPVKMVGVPVRLSETPGAIRSPSPSLGEHSAQVLREVLDMSDEQIQSLVDAGVVFTTSQTATE
jgi:crotonobetainyl-CoA:carnitine CoA-transferase CaiB-like acyl-CoA transferase